MCENEAVAGTEEYLNSEKYAIKMRDWNRPGNIKEFVALVNWIRNENSALHHLTNIRFLPADSDDILFYVKASLDRSNVLLAAVNLDPFQSHAHGRGAARGNWCCTGRDIPGDRPADRGRLYVGRA
jgi:starch synthase (maltosyl-transferring)